MAQQKENTTVKSKSNNTIIMQKLTKKYGDFIAVDDISFEIKKGETFALLGVNGAGKTTIIKMLSCLIQPTEGDAFLNGWSIKKDGNKIKQIINVSPQETAVAGNLTVRENIEFMGEIYGIPKKSFSSNVEIDKLQETSFETSLSSNIKVEKIQTISSKKLKKDMQEIEISEGVPLSAKVDNLIKQFGLCEVQNKKAKLLSGGMQRRLSIAMALVSDPQILFLDEPTLGLDVLARRELWKNIRALQGKVTILLTTHYMEEAESLSDRVGIMAHGKMLQIGTPAELVKKTKAKNFEDAFIKIAGGEVDDA